MKKNQFPIIAGIIAVVAVAGFFMMSGKEQKSGTAVPQLEFIKDEAQFTQKTKPFHIIPFGDPKLEFEIVLPADWTLQKLSLDQAPDLSKKIVGHIARIDSPMMATYRPYVTVQAVELSHEISARNWLKHFLFEQGYTPDGDIIENSIRRATSGYFHSSEGVSTYTRITAEINGNLALIVKFEAPLAIKDSLSFVMNKSIDSFKSIYTKETTIEPLKIFTLVDSIKFGYPNSWQVANADLRNPDRLSVQLVTKDTSQTINGYIRVLAVRRTIHTSIHQQIEEMQKYFAENLQVEFVKMHSSVKPPDISDRFVFSQFEIYDVKPKNSNLEQEIRLLALGDNDWYVFIFLLTQKETTDLLTWARNTRSLELLMQSIR